MGLAHGELHQAPRQAGYAESGFGHLCELVTSQLAGARAIVRKCGNRKSVVALPITPSNETIVLGVSAKQTKAHLAVANCAANG